MEISPLLFLLLACGGICGAIAFADARRLRVEVHQLKRTVERLSGAAGSSPGIETPPAAPPSDGATDTPRPGVRHPDNAIHDDWRGGASEESARPTATPSRLTLLFESLQRSWMIWLGGSCVTLAGVFLVRYSIDSGLLGPLARIVLALFFGTAFHVVAEWLRRRGGGTHGALAALSGAGSMTLYAALFAALKLYALIQPATAFLLMACVALATMVLARIHGPVLAAFGILGAYLVPILVADGGGQILIALAYAVVVSASALLLMRYVYRRWLWWGFAAGVLLWWAISLGYGDADAVRTLYLTLVAYLLHAIPDRDWLLARGETPVHGRRGIWPLTGISDAKTRDRVLLLMLILVAVFVNILVNPAADRPWLLALPFFVLACLLARRDATLDWLPWSALLVSLAAWLVAQVNPDLSPTVIAPVAMAQQPRFLGFLALQAAVAVGFALLSLHRRGRSVTWASMACMAPVLSIVVAFMLTARPDASMQWALGTLTLALAYLALAASVARRAAQDALVVWLFVAGHFALAVAAAMAFKTASLTLALAAQFASLAWVLRHFELPRMGWLLKAVVALVIARLTFNPWLPAYPADVHWSLWTYGGSTLFAALGAYWLRPYPRLSAWLEGAALHLLVLSLWAELRYRLYAGEVYASEFSFTEAVLVMLLFTSLALVYELRSRLSTSLGRFLRLYARALLILGVGLYLWIALLTFNSASWVYAAIGSTPLLNFLLPAFGAPVILAALYWQFFGVDHRRASAAAVAVSAFIFVSLEIRHLWTGTLRLDYPPVADAELYTYSAVWLLMAIAAVLLGSWKLGKDCYRGGMLLLGLVIAKLFLVDFSDLQGLLRVASFLGLGLSLLGISFLHQRLGQTVATARVGSNT